jgi:acetolactate synthase I/II/III large subunit
MFTVRSLSSILPARQIPSILAKPQTRLPAMRESFPTVPRVEVSVSRRIYDKLVREKVGVVFGFSGGTMLPMLDEFHAKVGASPKIPFVTNSHEAWSGFAAAGYARLTGKPGVVLTTSGPGLTNMITPLLDSLNDGVPMVLLSGQVATTAPADAFQGSPAVDLTKPCTKWSYQLKATDDIESVMARAFAIATSGRPGPVHIDLPVDLQKMATQSPVFFSTDMRLAPIRPSEMEMRDGVMMKIRDLICGSDRPLLYIGQGATAYPKAVAALVAKLNIPFTTTLHAKGVVDERHPLCLEMIGMHGHPVANFAAQQADLIIALGSRFDDRTVGNISLYAPEAFQAQAEGRGGFVHIDIRPGENGKVVTPNLFVQADVGDFLRQFQPFCPEVQVAPWITHLATLKAEYPVFHAAENQGPEVTIYTIMNTLNHILRDNMDDVVVSTGVGVHQMVAAQMMQMSTPRQFLSSGSLGTMGVSLGFAVGAQLADPSKLVISIDGDGSFNMSNIELKTIMSLNLPIKILVVNNSSEMMVEYWQKLFYDKRYISTPNQNGDYNVLADAYGIFNVRCEDSQTLETDLRTWLAHEGPALLNVITKKTPCLPLVKPGAALDDMILQDSQFSMDATMASKIA